MSNLKVSPNTAKQLREMLRGRNDADGMESTGSAQPTSVSNNRICMVQPTNNTGIGHGGMFMFDCKVWVFETPDLLPVEVGKGYCGEFNNGLITTEYYLAMECGEIADPPPTGLTAGRAVFLCGTRKGTIRLHSTDVADFTGYEGNIGVDPPFRFTDVGGEVFLTCDDASGITRGLVNTVAQDWLGVKTIGDGVVIGTFGALSFGSGPTAGPTGVTGGTSDVNLYAGVQTATLSDIGTGGVFNVGSPFAPNNAYAIGGVTGFSGTDAIGNVFVGGLCAFASSTGPGLSGTFP